jgi:hypothetical protein
MNDRCLGQHKERGLIPPASTDDLKLGSGSQSLKETLLD